MPKYQYRAMKVVQQPNALPFYMSSAPASELLEWCDVPRAKSRYMAGYQRILKGPRVGQLTNYLRLSQNNIIPAAVIIAVDSEYVHVDELGGGLFQLSIDEDTRDFQTKLVELWGHFTTRLAEEELESADISYSSPSTGPAGPSVEGDVEDDADTGTLDAAILDGDESELDVISDDDEAVEDDHDDDSVFPSSYLASLAKELTKAVEDWDSISPDRQAAIQSYIDGVSKPGLIIDGQHRVFGAKDVSEHDIELPVILLPGLAFAEQVFQFYVLNSTARPLKPTELRRIVSTSLTNAEILDLYDRFKAAGIEAEEARWTLEIHRQPSSPFCGRIDFGYADPGAIIPENVADQIVRAFMLMPRTRYKQLINPLGENWTDVEKRLEIFFWFWNAIKEQYAAVWSEAEAAADQGEKAQLFMKVALLTLQSFVLDRFVTALPYRSATDDPPLATQAEVANMVRSTLTNLPQEFFSRTWKLKQIDTSEGRKQLYAAMDHVWNNQGKINGNLLLFRG